MPAPLTDKTIALIKATVPALEAHGLTITRRMYERMFQNEAIRDLFNQSHHGETGSQPKALANAVLAYARNIDNLGVLGGAVERIAQCGGDGVDVVPHGRAPHDLHADLGEGARDVGGVGVDRVAEEELVADRDQLDAEERHVLARSLARAPRRTTRPYWRR